ncbi:hypothetical protein MRX96_054666 [Rhipicephalus microplus]
MSLEDMVLGEDISRQEDEASGWILAHCRKKWCPNLRPVTVLVPVPVIVSPAQRTQRCRCTSSSPRCVSRDGLKITTWLSSVSREVWTCTKSVD